MEDVVERPDNIVTITCDTTIKSAVDMMSGNQIGCLIVNDSSGKFAGIVTERDIVTRAVASSMDLEKATITEIMTPHVVSCPVGTPAGRAREIMAANHIRHLPVIDSGTVVGILSVRDLMGQQLLEDRAAAEEVAMLANCLKSIELSEAADTVTEEVPRIFHATRCLLCLWSTSSDTCEINDAPPVVASDTACFCNKEHITRPVGGSESAAEDEFYCDSIPDDCQKAGVEIPRMVIPLSILGPKEDSKALLSGYLCMCGLTNSSIVNRELTCYKAKLTREILTSHLTNASLYQQARLTSQTDALTGIGSRRLLEDALEAECARAKRYRRPFSVAILDLDNFKAINDVFGHATGDDALKRLAECMKSQKRIPDILTRYGGDEFVILMPETEASDALKFMERIRYKVRQIRVQEDISLTISCGVAQSMPDYSDSSSNMIRRADLALYEAKSSGRNCVMLWNEKMSKVLKAGDIEFEKIKRLKRRVAGLSEQAEKMFMQSIWSLVKALEAKDPYAKKHSECVMNYAVGIAKMMKISQKELEVIHRAAMIHDIGKIGIPDVILSKPDELTPRERKIIEQHPLIGVRILKRMSFLKQEVAIVRSHHEKWNGEGYPDGLSNTKIPIGARIMAVADTFDALISDRAYHNSRPIEEAIGILIDSSGYDFDPDVVNALVMWVRKVQEQHKNTDQLTPEDLLSSQKRSKDDPVTELIAETCSVDA